MICKLCKCSFHYCHSCGINGHGEYGYCSDICMDIAENENEDVVRLREIIDSIPKETIEELCELVINKIPEIIVQRVLKLYVE